MDNYYEQRLEEISQLLFKDGAFFSTMTEEEKDLFGEAVGLIARKTVEENGYQNEGQTYEDHNDNKNDNDQFSQIIDTLRGFNINVNITPSLNYDHVHGHNTGGGCDCDCNNPEPYPGHEYPEDKEYYTNAPINDGAYNPGPDDEVIYGEDMPIEPKDDKPEA